MVLQTTRSPLSHLHTPSSSLIEPPIDASNTPASLNSNMMTVDSELIDSLSIYSGTSIVIRPSELETSDWVTRA